MATPDELVKLFGTGEKVEPLREIALGPLSILLGREAIRRICWNDVELVRAIAWPIRDRNWGTLTPQITEESVGLDEATLSFSLSFTVADGALECELGVEASDDGSLRAELTMHATENFATNRAGITVLHPIAGVAGSPLSVTHSDGVVEETEFPRLISPGQPVMDIVGLRHSRNGATVDMAFDGEVFEMEDQRNWSDASYKTYCVPLVFPFTYEIAKGESRTQSIDITVAGDTQSAAASRSAEISLAPGNGVAPEIGLAVEPDWLESGEAGRLAETCGTNHVAARLSLPIDPQILDDLAALSTALGVSVDLEVVLQNEAAPLEALQTLAGQLAKQSIRPARVLALRASYLASHQPSGPWPDGPIPSDVVQAAREAFPDALIGGGMLTNFTEFNRCPPDPTLCDFVSHGSTAIVHAGDDLSVRETLEALPQIFDSAEALSGGKPYRLGLVSIGMRSNPYGAAVADNPDQVRQTMAKVDPRQRGLFAAAWAVGALSATAGGCVEALCLAAPCGPFGIAYQTQDDPQPYFDQDGSAIVYPIYHVFNTAAAMAGDDRLIIDGLPTGGHGYGVRRGSGADVMIANVSPDAIDVALGREGQWCVLDSASFQEATSRADWLDTATRQTGTQLNLAPYAVAFVHFAIGAA